ncbi:hypothetical protein LXT12_14935 [Pelomonas sp. P7]|uniref:Uncharacterized protein n=1 Tax=Pelomonas caseinilytica TaxID=2906763 RepID=A0ABS8XMV2_9BURK|nr:hypothetical protein [Pelomonas sp. P7]MCE4538545.1 hypothetical protein [Pelomonas sp. P7]
MPSRLYTFSPQLDRAFQRATLPSRRAAVLAACDAAVACLQSIDPVIKGALDCFRCNTTTPKIIEALKLFIDEKDGTYFSLSEAQDGTNEEALLLFSEARAASALLAAVALQPDQWHEAIYEAAMSTDDPSEIERQVNAALT